MDESIAQAMPVTAAGGALPNFGAHMPCVPAHPYGQLRIWDEDVVQEWSSVRKAAHKRVRLTFGVVEESWERPKGKYKGWMA